MITKLRIQNFKSLRDVTLDLQRVNLLIGPNNCGKTNVLKAVEFFSKWLAGDVPEEERLQILCYREEANNRMYAHAPFQLTVHANDEDTTDDGTTDVKVGHTFLFPSFRAIEDAPYRGIVAGCLQKGISQDMDITTDVTQIDAAFDAFISGYWGSNIPTPEGYKERDVGSRYSGKAFQKNGKEKLYSDGLFQSAQELVSFWGMPALKKDVWDNTWGKIEDTIIYRPEPSILLQVYPVRNEEEVEHDASNLVAFLYAMRDRYQDIFERITGDLRRFVPEYTDISFDLIEVERDDPIRAKYGDYSYAKVGLRDKHKRIFWAEDLSEGILYFLSLLAIIHQPKPPKMLLLEEPEKGMHPRRLREVLDLVFELAEEKDIQVIMTTHSPLVVDYFSHIPESVFILEKPENETIVKNLQRDIVEPYNKELEEAGEEPLPYTDALGEHWKMGFLGGVPHD